MPKAIGQDAVLARMKAVGQATRRGAAAQMEIEANALAEAIRAKAPELTGALKRSIKAVKIAENEWEVRAGGDETTKKIRGGVSDGDFAKAKAGHNNHGEFDYSRGVEFGHRTEDGAHVPAEPFFFDTYRARRAGIRRRIVDRSLKASSDPGAGGSKG